MGYYVSLEEHDFTIEADKLDAAYEALVKLNERDDLKTGGSWEGGRQTAKWFSWMPENYPEVYKDAFEVFEALGFDLEYTSEGHLTLIGYDSKSGAEDHFLHAVAPFVTPGSTLTWRGEDGTFWRDDFDGQTMEIKPGKITFE